MHVVQFAGSGMLHLQADCGCAYIGCPSAYGHRTPDQCTCAARVEKKAGRRCLEGVHESRGWLGFLEGFKFIYSFQVVIRW